MKLVYLLLMFFSSVTFRLDYVAEHRIDNFNINPKQYAINYYDPISFYNNSPQIGLTSISFYYNGVLYTFANEENKNKFIENFRLYEPRFGGWCAYSMTEGKKVDFEPEYYSIINDSLYLFSTKEKMENFKKDYDNLQFKAWDQWIKILPSFDTKDSVFRMK